MNKPENLTLRHYWEANSSEERIKIIEDAFAWIEHLEQNCVKSESFKMLNDLIKNGLPQDIQNSITRIETAHGDILVRRSCLLGDNDIKIITNEEALEALGDQLSEEDKAILRQKFK